MRWEQKWCMQAISWEATLLALDSPFALSHFLRKWGQWGRCWKSQVESSIKGKTNSSSTPVCYEQGKLEWGNWEYEWRKSITKCYKNVSWHFEEFTQRSPNFLSSSEQHTWANITGHNFLQVLLMFDFHQNARYKPQRNAIFNNIMRCNGLASIWNLFYNNILYSV